MKSKRQKSRDNPLSNLWKHKADAAWGQWVHSNYDRCAVNNKDCAGKLEAHHLISRTIRATRHCRENAILLCSMHHKYSPHLSPHMAPLQFAEWLQRNLPDRWNWVIEHRMDWKHIKADYKAACYALQDKTQEQTCTPTAQ